MHGVLSIKIFLYKAVRVFEEDGLSWLGALSQSAAVCLLIFNKFELDFVNVFFNVREKREWRALTTLRLIYLAAFFIWS